jgi:hypothetical protein
LDSGTAPFPVGAIIGFPPDNAGADAEWLVLQVLPPGQRHKYVGQLRWRALIHGRKSGWHPPEAFTPNKHARIVGYDNGDPNVG